MKRITLGTLNSIIILGVYHSTLVCMNIDDKIKQAEALVKIYEKAVAAITTNPTATNTVIFIPEGTLADVGDKKAVSYKADLRMYNPIEFQQSTDSLLKSYNPLDPAMKALDELQLLDATVLQSSQKDQIRLLIARITTATEQLRSQPELGTILKDNAEYNRGQFAHLSGQAVSDATQFNATDSQKSSYQIKKDDFRFLKIDPASKTFFTDLQNLDVLITYQATFGTDPAKCSTAGICGKQNLSDISSIEEDNFQRARNYVAAQWMSSIGAGQIRWINEFLDPLASRDLLLVKPLYLYQLFAELDDAIGTTLGKFGIEQTNQGA